MTTGCSVAAVGLFCCDLQPTEFRLQWNIPCLVVLYTLISLSRSTVRPFQLATDVFRHWVISGWLFHWHRLLMLCGASAERTSVVLSNEWSLLEPVRNWVALCSWVTMVSLCCWCVSESSFKPIHRGSTASDSSLAGLFSSTGGDSTPTGHRLDGPNDILRTVDESATVTEPSTTTAGQYNTALHSR